MNVFIDALSAKNGGGITYIENLLQRIPSKKKLKIYIATQKDFIYNGKDKRIYFYKTNWPTSNPLLRFIWQVFFLPFVLNSLKINSLFVPGGIVFTKKSQKYKLITMFRNMLPFDQKQIERYPYGIFKIKIYLSKIFIIKSLLKADKVIFISKFAENFITNLHKNIRNKSVIIHHGVNDIFYKKIKIHNRPTFLPKEKYLLYVSRLELYKRQYEVILAFHKILKEINYDLKLLLVGPSYNNYGKIIKKLVRKLNLQDKVLILGNIDHNILPAYYQFAEINLFCSEIENCPNILLEALASNRPILCSKKSPMPEFGGKAPLYCDVEDVNDVSEKIKFLLNNKVRMKYFAKKAREQAKLFIVKKSINETWKIILN